MKQKKSKKKLEKVPGWDIVSSGLKDISQGKCETVSALLVTMASSRLSQLGVVLPDFPRKYPCEDVHLRLYELLKKSVPDPYSQYNALQRRLVSFCHTMEQ